MRRLILCALGFCLVYSQPHLFAQPKKPIVEALSTPILEAGQTVEEVQKFVPPRIAKMPKPTSASEWLKQADHLRNKVLDTVVFRGEAGKWRIAKPKVETLATIEGKKGYRIKKIRYEAVPGMWIPALLYEPTKLEGKVPVYMAVNGHDRNGKVADYKQIRCINLAKRGVIVLNVEWVGMGQLRTDGFTHSRMNQLDLCGTSGVAPFFLSMAHGIDVLLQHPNADPKRVAVSGLSGGGWQTIFISGLDPRVTLCNPVAGYSSYHTRLRHFKDLGDSEQTPSDLGGVADYKHLTAMRAPRPTLLTYNAKDQCCFEAGYALPPLLDAARPFFRLYPDAPLASHINHDPGTHNYEKDNRQQFYGFVRDHFFAGDDKRFPKAEIECRDELLKRAETDVALPANNQDFHSLAMNIAKGLPRDPALPKDKAIAQTWQTERRKELRKLARVHDYKLKAKRIDSNEQDGMTIAHWKMSVGEDWTIPVVEFAKDKPKGTVILLNEAGKKADAASVEAWLKRGYRVLATDVFYFGECHPARYDYLFGLIIATVSERQLGVQVSQLTALGRWAKQEYKLPVTVCAIGPRLSTVTLVASALEPAIDEVSLHGAYGSLKEVIEQNRAVTQMPEMFCFGLLESFDLKQIAGLTVPRSIRCVEPSERVKRELADLVGLYKLWGKEHNPVKQ